MAIASWLKKPKTVCLGASAKALAAVLSVMLCGGLAFYLYGKTVVRWWIPVSLAVILGAALWFAVRRIWKRLMSDWPAGASFFVHMILSATVLSAGILGANHWGARRDSARKVKAEVTAKYQEKRYRTRRIGKGRYVKGESYCVYFVVCTFPDKSRKTFEVGSDTYFHIGHHSNMTMTIAPGLFSWPVVLRIEPFSAR